MKLITTIAVLATSMLSVIMAAPTSTDDFPSELIKSMDSHDHGFHALGPDGVLRTFHPDHTVIEAVRLSSAQIQQLIHVGGHNDDLASQFDGVDGHDVNNMTQLLHPAAEYVASVFGDDKHNGHDEHSPPQSPNPSASSVNTKASLSERVNGPVDFQPKIPLILPPPANPYSCYTWGCQIAYDCLVEPRARCFNCIHYPGDAYNQPPRCV